MRLLNVHTLKLESFFNNLPPYAILSHCWEEEEVIFCDLADSEAAKTKQGIDKINKTCEQSAKDGLDYCWIDTCCIDKSSSAELSEAINSMFAWYKNSNKCYAYLSDVEGPHDFHRSKWFTRAWTLQELLAPSAITVSTDSGQASGMDFFSRQWTRLGTKGGLSTTISEITGVAKEYLQGKSLDTASISMRMSWAADRQATRAEDIAYSLLGIFDINMALLYGEGRLKAFRRLQEEIMRVSEDETLFAWESTEFITTASAADVLASDPKDFTEARNLVPFASDEPVSPYTMTHRGLRIWIQLLQAEASETLRDWLRPLRSPVMIWSGQTPIWALLRCHVAHDFQNYVAIPLRYLAADVYIRDTSTNVALLPIRVLQNPPTHREIYIRNCRTLSIANSIQRQFGFLIRNLPPGFSIGNALPDDAWDPLSRVLQNQADSMNERKPWHASLQLKLGSTSQKASMFLSLGCKRSPGNEDPEPWCHLDDFVYTSDDVQLGFFHDKAFSLEQQREVVRPRDCDGGILNRRFTIDCSTERILGQRMFVVNVESTESFEGLRVPNKSRVQGQGMMRSLKRQKLEVWKGADTL